MCYCKQLSITATCTFWLVFCFDRVHALNFFYVSKIIADVIRNQTDLLRSSLQAEDEDRTRSRSRSEKPHRRSRPKSWGKHWKSSSDVLMTIVTFFREHTSKRERPETDVKVKEEPVEGDEREADRKKKKRKRCVLSVTVRVRKYKKIKTK